MSSAVVVTLANSPAAASGPGSGPAFQPASGMPVKHDLDVRPIFHKTEERIEAYIFVAFLACCLHVTLKANLRELAGGTTPREVIAKFKTPQMADVHLPTTDGRELTLPRYTQPEPEHRILLDRLRLHLPSQPPPKISAAQAKQAIPEPALSWRPAGLGQVKSTT